MPFSDSSFYFFLCIGDYPHGHMLHPKEQKLKAHIEYAEEYRFDTEHDSVVITRGTHEVDTLVCKIHTPGHQYGIKHIENQTHITLFGEHHPPVIGPFRICHKTIEIVFKNIFYKSHAYGCNKIQIQIGRNIHSQAPDKEVADYSTEPELNEEGLEDRVDVQPGLRPVLLQFLF